MRYFVTEPIKGGYCYYDVRDSADINQPNFSLVTIYKEVPGAKELAYKLADEFNGKG